MPHSYISPDPAAESAMLADLSIELPWRLVERFSTLVRESGSEDERIAAEYVQEQLTALGVPYTVYEPDLYLSVPRSAQVNVAAEGKTLRAKPPAFSAITGPDGLTGEVLYVPIAPAEDMGDIFDRTTIYEADVAGKIVLTEGMGMPGAVYDLERRGAIGQIHINPGENIHWSICTTIWGSPDLDNISRKPSFPVVSVNNEDGLWLRELAQLGRFLRTTPKQRRLRSLLLPPANRHMTVAPLYGPRRHRPARRCTRPVLCLGS